MTRMRDQGYTLTSICDYVGISRQAYHKRITKSQDKNGKYSKAEAVVLQHRQKRSRVGLRTIYHKARLNSLLGINDYEKEMSSRGFALQPYRSFFKTTDSRGHTLFILTIYFCQNLMISNCEKLMIASYCLQQHQSKLYMFKYKNKVINKRFANVNFASTIFMNGHPTTRQPDNPITR